MTALTPPQAAAIAKGVYDVQDAMSLEDANAFAIRNARSLGIDHLFSTAESTRFTGTTGPFFVRTRTGFGYAARGIESREGELLVAMRGTVGWRDWLTDGNMGYARGPTGHTVHSGFNDTFNSLIDQLVTATGGTTPTAVHCVGHSLGGALASLTAAHLTQAGFRNIRLYTFGSPRVGLSPFSRYLQRQIGAGNIYRVYHDCDPVSMVPIFPYQHVPFSGTIYPLTWGGGMLFYESHFMANYVEAVAGATWDSLAAEPVDPLAADVRTWLNSAGSGGLMFSATTLWMISRALQWLIGEIVVGVVGVTLAGAATMLDKLAWIIATGAAAAREFADYAVSLMRRIMAWMGRTVAAGVNLTVAFVRWVLSMLFSIVGSMARRAIGGLFIS